jgi:branched-subunit amino acid transport protein
VSPQAGLVIGCAAACGAIKLAGPVLLGGRKMPEPFTRVVMLMAPALLAALVVTQALADGARISVGANTAGVAVGGLVAWRRRSEIAAVVAATLVAGLLRIA